MKYQVTLYYYTNVTVEVEADNINDAMDDAYQEVKNPKYEKDILNGLEEVEFPTISWSTQE